jgi:putative transcriptional regulator
MNKIDLQWQVMRHNSLLRKNSQAKRAILSSIFIIAVLALIVLPGIPASGVISKGKHAFLTPARIPESAPPKDQLRSKIQPAKGRFLVASRQLDKSVFAETVILLLDYGLQGATGLIINMPTEIKLSQVFPKVNEFEQLTDKVYLGGPVNRTQMFLLVRSINKPEDSISVFEDIYVSASMKTLMGLAGNMDGKLKFHVYAGYAGWAPGQLDREIMMGSWHVSEGDAETVFHKKPSEIWQKYKRRKSPKLEMISL